MSLHKNISKLRKLNDLTQPTMAELLNVSTSTYSRMENGESGIDATLLPKDSRNFQNPNRVALSGGWQHHFAQPHPAQRGYGHHGTARHGRWRAAAVRAHHRLAAGDYRTFKERMGELKEELTRARKTKE